MLCKGYWSCLYTRFASEPKQNAKHTHVKNSLGLSCSSVGHMAFQTILPSSFAPSRSTTANERSQRNKLVHTDAQQPTLNNAMLGELLQEAGEFAHRCHCCLGRWNSCGRSCLWPRPALMDRTTSSSPCLSSFPLGYMDDDATGAAPHGVA